MIVGHMERSIQEKGILYNRHILVFKEFKNNEQIYV